jgi:hypothetical protein
LRFFGRSAPAFGEILKLLPPSRITALMAPTSHHQTESLPTIGYLIVFQKSSHLVKTCGPEGVCITTVPSFWRRYRTPL